MLAFTTRTLALTHLPDTPVWTRLGFRSGHTDPQAKRTHAPLIARFLQDTAVRVCFREAAFALHEGEASIEDDPIDSRLVAERCADASSVLLMAATVAPEQQAHLERLKAEGPLLEAVVLDAVLSEKVDQGLDFLEKELAVTLRRENRRLGPRISCGYGDFRLEYQSLFVRALRLEDYGVRLNERFILTPEKSVTALAPIFIGVRPA